MTPMEIALLVMGVIIFAVSFLLPGRTPAKSARDIEKEKEEIRRLMGKELDGMKLRVNEATNETVEYAMEKTERSLEKISNEKIMAVNEYSDTIMEEINKSHKEVMFLYDMLSDKQVDLKNTVRKAEAAAKEAETLSETAQTANELLKKNLSVISVARNDKKILPEKDHASDRAGDREGIGYTVPVTYDFKKEQSVFKEAERKPQTEEPEQSRIQPLFSRIKEEAADDAALTLTSEADIMKPIPKKQEQLMDSTAMSSALQQKKQPVKGSTRMGENNNQRILELYGQKKSYVEIARELNLGVGEVKLVIDLFKG